MGDRSKFYATELGMRLGGLDLEKQEMFGLLVTLIGAALRLAGAPARVKGWDKTVSGGKETRR